MLPTSIQGSVDRFARSLEVPHRLIKLHPRTPGNPGDAAALAPAVALGVISAFEGFAEDFLALVLALRGQSFGQIAKRIGKINNPTIKVFCKNLTDELPALRSRVGVDFRLATWEPPTTSKWWQEVELTWDDAMTQSEGWMQVRHCLSHGLASGWRSEYWPGSTTNMPAAITVLRPRSGGKHSLTLHGAITCARIYTLCAQHLTELAAAEVGEIVSWDKVPYFDLRAAKTEAKPET